jgi:hypothetical protein
MDIVISPEGSLDFVPSALNWVFVEEILQICPTLGYFQGQRVH